MSASKAGAPPTVIATYRVQKAREKEFLELLGRHHPALLELGLVTPDPPVVYRAEEEDGAPTYFEIFTWASGDAPNIAHETPEVMAIWEPMGALVEERGGRPSLEFPHVERVEPPRA